MSNAEPTVTPIQELTGVALAYWFARATGHFDAHVKGNRVIALQEDPAVPGRRVSSDLDNFKDWTALQIAS